MGTNSQIWKYIFPVWFSDFENLTGALVSSIGWRFVLSVYFSELSRSVLFPTKMLVCFKLFS